MVHSCDGCDGYFPLIWAQLVIPDLGAVLAAAPANEIWTGGILGFFWGIGGIMFGISVGYIGMSLTYGIVMGLCSIAGALVPFILRFDAIYPPSIPYILGGLAILALAVYVVTIAGLKRDACLAERGQQLEGIKTGSEFRVGLIIASVCGILSAMLAVGFDNTVEIGRIAEEQGAIPRNTALARWVVVLVGAYLMNAGYSVVLLIKNRSFSSFGMKGTGSVVKWAIIAGLLWFAAGYVWARGCFDGGYWHDDLLADDVGSLFDCEQCGGLVCGGVEGDEKTVPDFITWGSFNHCGNDFDVVCLNIESGLK